MDFSVFGNQLAEYFLNVLRRPASTAPTYVEGLCPARFFPIYPHSPARIDSNKLLVGLKLNKDKQLIK